MYKVVIVEDEKLVRNGIMLGTDWSSIDCIVVGEAGNGAEGYEIIKKIKPDVVITDIQMPEISGIEMIEKLQQENLHPAVIFLTAFDDFRYAQKAVRLAAADYILKPFEDGQLEETVKNALQKANRWVEKAEGEENHSPELQLQKGDKSKYIMEAIEYIDKNYASPDISVQKVALSLGISEGHLSHLFRKETEFTLMNYITNCRIRGAKKLLKNYKYKIYEVAELVGYHDITYFSATFKKIVGVSPSEYQDRHR